VTGTSPYRPNPGARHETLLRVASIACALVVVAATILHALQLRGAMQTAAEGRLLTVSRILAKEANRTLLQTRGLIDQVDEVLRAEDGLRGVASAAGLEALLEALPRQQTLLRAIAVVGRDGRVLASSDRRHVGLDLSALDFMRAAADDGRLHLGVPKSGRGFAEDAREGPEHAFDGWITLSRVTVGRADRPRVVAVIGSSSWIGDLKFVSSDEDLLFTVYRYDGTLLAGSDPAIAKRRTPHPIFTGFLPDRETGAFEDLPGDARRWMVHFDTTADFPVVVEARMHRSVVVAGWERELIAPLLVMLVTLIALVLYTWMTARALRSRARSELQAATQERRLRNIVDTAADGIVTVDAQGIVRDFNRAAETIFGVPAAEAVGRPLAALLPDDDPERDRETGDDDADPGAALERWRAAQTGFDAVGRARTLLTRRRDGHPVELQFAVSAVHDQGELLYTGIVRDVTEMRQAEERFRTLFQRSGEPHLLFDRDGLVDCNDAAAMLLRAGGRDALLGRRLDELAPASQTDATSAEVIETAIAQARADGVKRLVWTARALDGIEFPVEMTLTPIRLGDHDAMLVAWHDIAERERHERQLREARDAAESAASAKAQFLAMMSHELRTPMTGIIGMIDLLRDTRMTDEQGRIADVLQGSAHALLTVLNDVLDYSRRAGCSSRRSTSVPTRWSARSPRCSRPRPRSAAAACRCAGPRARSPRCAATRPGCARCCSTSSATRSSSPSAAPSRSSGARARSATAASSSPSRCPTPASASRPRCCRHCSARSSRPTARRPAASAAPAWALRSAATWSRRWAARSASTASPVSVRPSASRYGSNRRAPSRSRRATRCRAKRRRRAACGSSSPRTTRPIACSSARGSAARRTASTWSRTDCRRSRRSASATTTWC
jgi:PAS domain S-box-containing protein